MTNYFFEDENISENDLYFLCYMIERLARTLHQRNSYVVNALGYDELVKKISLADVLHCENPMKVVDDWIKEYGLKSGDFHIENIDKDLVDKIPTETQMGKVYKRLILQTMEDGEDYIQSLMRVYNASITDIIDNYNTGAYYSPSYILKRAYDAGSFDAIN